MSHSVERLEGVMEELGGRAACKVATWLHSHRLSAEGRAWLLHGRAKRDAAIAADRAEAMHALEERVNEVCGTEPKETQDVARS